MEEYIYMYSFLLLKFILRKDLTCLRIEANMCYSDRIYLYKEIRMVRINEVEIKNKSWMQVVINKDDGYVNGTKLADQIGMNLYQFFKLEDITETIEHIKVLTGDKDKYESKSSWDNVKGVYVHPFLALEMVAIKKNEDSDYEEYYEFIRETIFEFLENNQELKEKYHFIEEFHG